MDFLSEPSKPEKRFSCFFTGIIIVQIIMLLVGLTLTGGLAYVAWHFISKVW